MSGDVRARGGSKTAVSELQQRVRELQLLHETGRRLASLLDTRALLPEMIEQLRSVLGVQIVSIMLVDETTSTLRIVAQAGLPDDVVAHARVPVGEGISGQVAARGEPVLITDVSRTDAFARSPYHAQYTTESLICAPLRLGDRVLGVVNVNNKLDGEPLDESDLALVATFSSQAALALENSRLYGNLEAEVERVTAALRRSNEELRRAREFSESIVRNMSSGLVALDLSGRVSELNAAGAAILGLPAGMRTEDETMATLFGEAGARRVLAEPEAPHERREVVVRSRDGRDVPLGFSTSPLLDGDGRKVGVVVIFRDLTHVKKMEAELVRMDRMASLGVLGAGIAHEIRNPLAAIRFNLDFLREEGTRHEELDVILKNVERLDDLVRKLMRFARPQPPSFEAQALAPRVDAVMSLIRKQAGAAQVALRAEHDPSLPPVRIDGPQVEQVVLNIALNGIQAMPEGGTLAVRTRQKGDFGEIAITDDGVGLTPAAMQQIFDPFFTTREEGTGLGLAVAHRIVEDHDGYIRVEPNPAPARGTTFVIGFPLAPRPSSEDALTPPKGSGSGMPARAAGVSRR